MLVVMLCSEWADDGRVDNRYSLYGCLPTLPPPPAAAFPATAAIMMI